MKKSILFIGALLIAAALGAVAFQNQVKEEAAPKVKQVRSAASFDDKFVNFMNADIIPDVIFNIDSRFTWEITKEDVLNAKTVADLIPAEAMENVLAIDETRVTLVGEGDEEEVWGSGMELNAEQLKILSTMDYSTDFYVEAYHTGVDLVRRKIVYFHSIVPENQTQYEEGMDDLLSHIEKASRTATDNVKQSALRPGRISFVINEEGTIKDLKKTSTSGYIDLDEKMLETMENLPKKWKPATNAKGEPVEQTLILFFGIQGC